MRALLVFAVVPLLLASVRAQTDAAEEPMAKHSFESRVHGKLPYRSFVPNTKASDGKLPLVLFLHGAGERGTDNEAQLRHGVRTFLGAAQEQRPCVVVAPQCPKGRWWDIDLLLEFAETLLARADVDKDRFYLTGLSMGGFATWHMIGRRPDLFAAAVPVCGGGETDQAPGLVHMPIWAFHGDADSVVKVAQSRAMVEAIRKAGGQPKYTEYQSVPHDSWTRTYADQAVHAWLFAQRRKGTAPAMALHAGDRVVFFGDSITESAVHERGYVRVLEAELAARAPALGVELIGAGISGHRVPDLLARVDRDVIAKKPNVVVIYIGINDVWHSLSGRGTKKDEYGAGLRTLVQKLNAAQATVLLCTPSVIGEKKAGANQLDAMLDEYAAITRGVAAELRVPLLDLRQLFVDHLATHNAKDADRGVLTTDGVHLNDAGNRFVAERLRQALLGS
jgi:lysophospholipase L1-like esterase/poly(3-hydroxybutyrate) depolymerase